MTYRGKYLQLYILIFYLLMCMSGSMMGQESGGNDPELSPDSVAAMFVDSLGTPLLKMLRYERDRWPEPQEGMVIFSLEDSTIEYYNGTKWILSDSSDAPGWTCGDSIADAEGNHYPTVSLAGQCWMSGNMNIGTNILTPVSQSNVAGNYEKYCANNKPENCDIYGGLYQWKHAMQQWSGQLIHPVRGICPEGWHIPDFHEWQELYKYLTESFGASAAGALKEQGARHWKAPNTGLGVNNIDGDLFWFAARPGGASYVTSFGQLNQQALFWLADQVDGAAAKNIVLKFNQGELTLSDVSLKSSGFSVRCLKD